MNSVGMRSIFAHARLRAETCCKPDEAEQHVIPIDAHMAREHTWVAAHAVDEAEASVKRSTTA